MQHMKRNDLTYSQYLDKFGEESFFYKNTKFDNLLSFFNFIHNNSASVKYPIHCYGARRVEIGVDAYQALDYASEDHNYRFPKKKVKMNWLPLSTIGTRNMVEKPLN